MVLFRPLWKLAKLFLYPLVILGLFLDTLYSEARKMRYRTVHATAFFVLIGLLWISIHFSGGGNIDSIDSLFTATSTGTNTGLNTVLLSKLNTAQQVAIEIGFRVGHVIVVTWLTVLCRQRKLRPYHEQWSALPRAKKQEVSEMYDESLSRQVSSEARQNSSTTRPDSQKSSSRQTSRSHGSRASPNAVSNNVPDPAVAREAFGREGWVDRNKGFHNLTDEEWLFLYHMEYCALSILSWAIPIYWICWECFGLFICGWYIAVRKPEIALNNGVNPWWAAAATAIGAFSNGGLNLLDDSLASFSEDILLLLSCSLLTLAGNTCFPVFLRISLELENIWICEFPKWAFFKRIPWTRAWQNHCKEQQRAMSFLLRYPRRCCTHLFSRADTLWLLGTVVTLTTIDVLLFIILDLKSPVLASLSLGVKIVVGIFLGVSLRASGMSVIAISALTKTVQLAIIFVMLVVPYPVAFFMRAGNVYQERSLGIYQEELEPRDKRVNDHPGILSRIARRIAKRYNIDYKERFLHRQLSKQAGGDIAVVAVATFIIVAIEELEGNALQDDPENINVFNILFEVASAYGCVGVSIGYPGKSTRYVPFSPKYRSIVHVEGRLTFYSLSAQLNWKSKLVLCIVMFLGRHRGLPLAMDHALELPGSKDIHEAVQLEEMDGQERAKRYEAEAEMDRLLEMEEQNGESNLTVSATVNNPLDTPSPS